MNRLIHILSAGAALCGRAGQPITWDAHEAWVDPDHAHLASCPDCIAATGQTVASLRKQGRQREK
jgi:hypothetical protein